MRMTDSDKMAFWEYPCPCCGYVVFDERPGSYDICPICFWEDDLLQLRFPRTSGGANKVSLIDGQENFRQLGVCESRLKQYVRSPIDADRREPGWRPIDLAVDNIEERVPGQDYGTRYPRDRTSLYYWRNTYWRRSQHESPQQ